MTPDNKELKRQLDTALINYLKIRHGSKLKGLIYKPELATVNGEVFLARSELK